jgi:hypothetical protein
MCFGADLGQLEPEVRGDLTELCGYPLHLMILSIHRPIIEENTNQ